MKRFWFEFQFDVEFDNSSIPFGTLLGCGVTAFDYDDAVQLIKQNVFKNESLLKITKVVENVDVTTLDQGHVIPNMSPPNYRGIWFPLGYD